MVSVLLTRSSEENLALFYKLKQLGFISHSCPLIEYYQLKLDWSNIFKNYSNFIITSKQAAKLVAAASLSLPKRKIDIWMVGHSSEKFLSSLACFNIRRVSNNIKELMSYLPKDMYPVSIYLSSNEITSPLPAAIARTIIYRVQYPSTITQSQLNIIANEIDYILLYSKNCAKTLIYLMDKYFLTSKLENITVITISAAVAAIVRPYFKNVLYTPLPRQQQMLKLLTEHAAKVSPSNKGN